MNEVELVTHPLHPIGGTLYVVLGLGSVGLRLTRSVFGLAALLPVFPASDVPDSLKKPNK